jgi:NADH-quinone oxidoreductase subunit N
MLEILYSLKDFFYFNDFFYYFLIQSGVQYFNISQELILIIIINIFIIGYAFQDIYPELQIHVVIKILYWLLIWLFFIQYEEICYQYYAFNMKLEISFLVGVILCVILISFFLVLLFLREYVSEDNIFGIEILVFMLIMFIGLMLTLKANHFVLLFVGLEMQSIASYILAAYKRNSLNNIEAGLKYFLLGAYSSALFVFGISLIYGYTGSFYYSTIDFLYVGDRVNIHLLFGFLFVLIGLLFKLGAVPYHMWVPDVYAGVSWIVLSFFAIIPKIVIIIVLIKMIGILGNGLLYFWVFLIGFSGIASLMVGSFGALYQLDIKRFFAYSAITNVGYVLLAFITNTLLGFRSILVYILIYQLNTISFFSFIIGLRNKVNFQMIRNFKFLEMLYDSGKSLVVAVTVILFSFIGLPPLSGFFGKFYILLALFENNWYVLLFVFLLINAVAAVYYLAIIKRLFFNENRKIVYLLGLNLSLGRVLIYSVLLQVIFLYYDALFLLFLDNCLLEMWLK